jgi:hypothetical protein
LTGAAQAADKPAMLGGKPARTKGYPSWPMVDAAGEESVLEVVRPGRWYRNRSPENDKLCEKAVWFSQKMFLGPRSDMDEIAEAVRKIRAHAPALVRA